METTSANIDRISSAQSMSNTHPPFLQRIIARFKAKRQARKILMAITEADEINKGHKAGKSYDRFLEEI